jgi:hypothetical protein
LLKGESDASRDATPHLHVDIKSCIEKFSKTLIKHILPPATRNTILVDLVRFTPGCPESATISNGTDSPQRSPSGHDFNARSFSGQPVSPRGTKRKMSPEADEWLIRPAKHAVRRSLSHSAGGKMTAAWGDLSPYSNPMVVQPPRSDRVDKRILSQDDAVDRSRRSLPDPQAPQRPLESKSVNSAPRLLSDTNSVTPNGQAPVRKIKLLVKPQSNREEHRLQSSPVIS